MRLLCPRCNCSRFSPIFSPVIESAESEAWRLGYVGRMKDPSDPVGLTCLECRRVLLIDDDGVITEAAKDYGFLSEVIERCIDCQEGRECYRGCPGREPSNVEAVLNCGGRTNYSSNNVDLRDAPTDRQLLDWLEAQNAKSYYTRQCIFRLSTTGRGWRLHETSQPGAHSTVRDAISAAIKAEAEAE